MCRAKNAIFKKMVQSNSTSPASPISQNEEEEIPQTEEEISHTEKEVEIPLNDVIINV